jgi:hypothetical protein
MLHEIVWSRVGHAFYMHVSSCILSLDLFYVPPVFLFLLRHVSFRLV